ncbi:hypothetical protein DICVIV_12831 [Dictyocaulus viviparus]|uniref:Uncharacterized protein n=1 Tax=Dictyocaulus viviparus TaxID=29172 RepID=A0A0D8XBT1_DICVI|nr:hypothetical protein DICVIV_12831 [Dictyocaulus viviparus]
MCHALSELGEEGNEDYVVCDCLHSFVACLAFQVFDFFAVFITLLVYGAINYSQDTSIHTLLPLFTLILSAIAFPTGAIGLLYEKTNLLVIYNTRISLIVLWSFSWMIVTFLVRGDVVGLVTSLFWFIAAVFYFWGLFVTSKALTYVTSHYKGYDDVDPERVQYIEQLLRDLMDEIKQKELDIAAGAIVADNKPTLEKSSAVAPRRPPEINKAAAAIHTPQVVSNRAVGNLPK